MVKARYHHIVIASEAKQSIARQRRMDCFVAYAPRSNDWLHLRRDQILHLHAVAILDDLGDPLPVAMGVVALITENTYRSGLLHQRRQLVELLPGLRRLEMRRIDLVQQTELAATRRLTAALRRPQVLQVQIGNAALVETRCELILGEP